MPCVQTPTKTNPCLIVCPREKMMTVYMSPAKSPAVIKMDKLKSVQDLYEPVIFSHRIHMQKCLKCQVDAKCVTTIIRREMLLAVIMCHEPVRQRTDISKPDLKGAYHQAVY